MKGWVVLVPACLFLACSKPQVIYQPQEVKIPVPVYPPAPKVPEKPKLPEIKPDDPVNVRLKKLAEAIAILMADDDKLRELLRAYGK